MNEIKGSEAGIGGNDMTSSGQGAVVQQDLLSPAVCLEVVQQATPIASPRNRPEKSARDTRRVRERSSSFGVAVAPHLQNEGCL